jgi:hypothetical protein
MVWHAGSAAAPLTTPMCAPPSAGVSTFSSNTTLRSKSFAQLAKEAQGTGAGSPAAGQHHKQAAPQPYYQQQVYRLSSESDVHLPIGAPSPGISASGARQGETRQLVRGQLDDSPTVLLSCLCAAVCVMAICTFEACPAARPVLQLCTPPPAFKAHKQQPHPYARPVLGSIHTRQHHYACCASCLLCELLCLSCC